MNRTLQTADERLNDLVTELTALTGEDEVTVMCQALEGYREQLVPGRAEPAPRVIKLRLVADIPEDLLHRSDR